MEKIYQANYHQKKGDRAISIQLKKKRKNLRHKALQKAKRTCN